MGYLSTPNCHCTSVYTLKVSFSILRQEQGHSDPMDPTSGSLKKMRFVLKRGEWILGSGNNSPSMTQASWMPHVSSDIMWCFRGTHSCACWMKFFQYTWHACNAAHISVSIFLSCFAPKLYWDTNLFSPPFSHSTIVLYSFRALSSSYCPAIYTQLEGKASRTHCSTVPATVGACYRLIDIK